VDIVNRLAGGDDELSAMNSECLRIANMKDLGDGKLEGNDKDRYENENENEDGDGDDDDDEPALAELRLDEENEVVADGTNVIDERRVITSQGSDTEIDQFGNLKERLIGLGNGCFCEEVGYQKDSRIETPMVRQRESARGEVFMVCVECEKHTVRCYGMQTFAKWMLRIGLCWWRTTLKEQDDVCGQAMVRMGVG